MQLRHSNTECVVAAFVCASICGTCPAAELGQVKWEGMEDAKISVTFRAQAPGSKPVDGSAKVLFSNKYAISAVFDPDARYGQGWDSLVVFDLDKLAWYEASLKHWVDMKSCLAWEQASIERTKASLSNSTDTETRAFVEAIINPRFQIQKNQDGTIVISNSHLHYSVTPAKNASQQQLERFLAYDRLNAYRKAMTERQLPPTAQAAVGDVLLQQKVFPLRFTTKIKGAKNDVSVTTNVRIESFEPSDAELVRKALATYQP